MKIEKNKRKEEKKGKKRNRTETVGPAQHRIDPHGPTNHPEPFSLSLSDGWSPPVGFIVSDGFSLSRW
jgi:hypothetical protein